MTRPPNDTSGSMSPSRFDWLYKSVLLSKYFVKGWGDPEGLKRILQFRKIISDRESCYKLVDPNHPVIINKVEQTDGAEYIEGEFHSPFDLYLPDLIPTESKKVYFQCVLPIKWRYDNFKPVCLHMAGTGDHYFWRRRNFMAKPLLKESGIGSIIIENPFYGLRKPKCQVRSTLHNVSDIFIMGGCLVLEALVLFHWAERKGLGPLGVTGISMGGHMASLAATNWPSPLVLVPCLSWTTASTVFTEGVMSNSINWDMLESQYSENVAFKAEIESILNGIESDAFRAGQEFVKNFPSCLKSDYHSPVPDISPNDPEDPGELKYTRRLKSDFGLAPLIFTLNEKIVQSILRSPQSNMKRKKAIQFMRGIMDECTHLRNYSVPVDTSVVICVSARYDGYVPRESSTDLQDIWPGVEVRFIDAGHVSAFLLHLTAFRKAIIDGFEKYRLKYYSAQ